MTGGAAGCSVAALTLRGRPLGRAGLMAPVDVEGPRGGIGSDGADANSSATGGSGGTPCKAIFAANASSTSFASSVERRVLGFRKTNARRWTLSFCRGFVFSVDLCRHVVGAAVYTLF